MRIFVLEDNKILVDQIKIYFESIWYHVEIDFDTDRAYDKLNDEHFDVLILDINLPKMNWLNFCKKLRERWNNIPILMLTSMSSNKDMIIWLDSGADDYLWKPFEYEVLKARVNALYRRDSVQKKESIDIDDIHIDLNKRKVFKKKEEIILTTFEFNLLEYLIRNKSEPQTRKDIFEVVWWKFDDYMFSRNVDVYIWLLRKKLWDNFIRTVKWFWYVID